MNQELDILYEDENVFVINKPAGLIVHSDGRTKEKTLADLLIERYPEIKEVGEVWTTPEGEKIYRPGIVHRLDRETSGVLIVARNQETFLFFKEEFKNRNVEKKYHAFVYGNIKEDSGVIDKPIGKSKKDFRQWSAQPGSRGVLREAVTEFAVLGRTGDYTYIEASPKTGRTHQIRVHLKAIHHPIVCDSLYAKSRSSAFGFLRTALHSRFISFSTKKGQVITVEAPFPEDFQKALAEL